MTMKTGNLGADEGFAHKQEGLCAKTNSAHKLNS